jgi:ribosomal protein S12 methylthiotransferase
MLKAMRRQITRTEMEELLEQVRETVPGICLRTTLITGFPGESLDDVEELKLFLEKQRFDRVGIFTYSHEENTSAFDLKDNIAAEEKQRRAEDIMSVQQEISYEKNQRKVGQIFKVLIDKKEAGRYIGRTEFDSVEVDNEVIIASGKKLQTGYFYNVRITKAFDYDLEGEVIG